MFSLSAPDLCIYNENSLNSPFVRAGQPDQSVRKTESTNLKDEFYSSPLSFFEKKKKKNVYKFRSGYFSMFCSTTRSKWRIRFTDWPVWLASYGKWKAP